MLAASDILLLLASAIAAISCILLSKKIRKLSSLEGEIGRAIALLSKEVDDLSRATKAAHLSLHRAQESRATAPEPLAAAKRPIRFQRQNRPMEREK